MDMPNDTIANALRIESRPANRPMMRARDLMAADVVTVAPNAPFHVVVETMIERSVTGLPVVDGARRLLGLVTESDLLHRLVAAEQRQHGYMWGVFHSISRQADEYARSHGRLVADVMTLSRDLATASEETTAEQLARVMEERRIRHIPIVQDGDELLGMVTRAHLLRAALRIPDHSNAHVPDNIIRRAIVKAMREQPWTDTHFTFVDVQNGVVTFSGLARNERVQRGLRTLAEEVPGVMDVVFLTKPSPRYWLGAP